MAMRSPGASTYAMRTTNRQRFGELDSCWNNHNVSIVLIVVGRRWSKREFNVAPLLNEEWRLPRIGRHVL